MTDNEIASLLERIVQLQDESVRLQALAYRKVSTGKAEFISDLSEVGFENSRIAALLDGSVTTDAVRSAVNRSKKASGG